MWKEGAAVTMQQFSEENLKGFAAAWFRALDIHAPTEEAERFLAIEGLEMIFPEQTLKGIEDFRAWYAGGSYSDGTQAPGVINIFFDEIHEVRTVTSRPSEEEADAVVVDVVVGWQASWFEPPAAKSKRVSLNATQRWVVRSSPHPRNEFGLEILSYDAMAEPFEYAPGFSTL
jgi:hypothetical protein